MPEHNFPDTIRTYLALRGGDTIEAILACFDEDAKVWDNGEDLELTGISQIREWLAGTVSEYKLKSEIKSGEAVGEKFVVSVVVSGEFPGSPYEFAYRFLLRGDKIAELVIDPVGSLAP